MSYCDIADLALLSSWDDMQSLTTAQLQNLIDRGARWIRRYTKQDFANETNPDTLADLKWVNCLLAEYLWYFDQTDTKSATYQNIAGEKIGDYQYTTKLNNTTQIKKIGELTGNEELDSILVSLKIEIIGFNYFSLSGPSCGVRGGIPVSNGNSSDFNALVARVDALEILVNENNVDVNARIDALQISLVDEMDNRMNAIDTRVDTLEADLTTLTTTVNAMGTQVDNVETQANAAMVKATNAPLIELPVLSAQTKVADFALGAQGILTLGTIFKDSDNMVADISDPNEIVIQTAGSYLLNTVTIVNFFNLAQTGNVNFLLLQTGVGAIRQIVIETEPNIGNTTHEQTTVLNLVEGDKLQLMVINSTDNTVQITSNIILSMFSGNLPKDI